MVSLRRKGRMNEMIMSYLKLPWIVHRTLDAVRSTTGVIIMPSVLPCLPTLCHIIGRAMLGDRNVVSFVRIE
jgi:hypothetical protein